MPTSIDVTSRDDIPVILLGLQHIYKTPPLRDAVFKILEEVAPTKLGNDIEKVVSINKGRPGMDQWSILVLGALRYYERYAVREANKPLASISL